MKRCLAALALLAMIGSLGCSKLVSAVKGYTANGQDAIQAAFRAKAAAKSFTMVTRVAAHDDNVMETHFYVSCPDHERITLKMGSKTREMVRMGKRFYINEDGTTWYYKDVAVENWSPCGENPGLPSPWALLTEGRDLLTVFASAKDKFKVEWAQQVEYKGEKLDRWTVGMNHAGDSAGFKYTVILDKQQRPLLIGLGQSSLTEYSDWNKPVSIEAPAGALPYPDNAGVADPTPRMLAPGHGNGKAR